MPRLVAFSGWRSLTLSETALMLITGCPKLKFHRYHGKAFEIASSARNYTYALYRDNGVSRSQIAESSADTRSSPDGSDGRGVDRPSTPSQAIT